MSYSLGFVGAQIDRADHIRTDKVALEKGLASARTYVFWRARPLVSADHQSLISVSLDHSLAQNPDMRVFLGIDHGKHIYAVDISSWVPETSINAPANALFDESEVAHPDAPKGAVFTDARFAMGALTQEFAQWTASAKALFHWHRNHQFCSKCGAPSVMAKAGWERKCTSCSAVHYPRVDPSVIMLVTHGNQLLLGRSPGWPEKMYSCLAGFMEPGETIEMAVAREVKEEAGIDVHKTRYLLSQPWPYPSSLMIGCITEAKTTEIDLDTNELEDALWISKEALMLHSIAEKPAIIPARRGAIAHRLISAWLKDEINQLNGM